MARMSTYLRDWVFTQRFGAGAYLALFTSPTTDAGGGDEVTGGAYARQLVLFTGPVNGIGSNSGQVVFVDLPAAAITHAALMAAASGGEMLVHGPLASMRVVTDGDDLPFEAGDIQVTFG